MTNPADRKIIRIRFMWVPPELGGHRVGPWLGMRLQIRWQRPDEVRDRITHDVQCLSLTYDADARIGTGDFGFIPGSAVSDVWLVPQVRVTLVNADRVLAVGVIEKP